MYRKERSRAGERLCPGYLLMMCSGSQKKAPNSSLWCVNRLTVSAYGSMSDKDQTARQSRGLVKEYTLDADRPVGNDVGMRQMFSSYLPITTGWYSQ